MRIQYRKFQEGGPMPAGPEGAPQGPEGGQGGGDPVQELAAMAQQALQGQDCQAAMQVCDGFLQLVGGGGQGGPQGGPEGGAPAPGGAPEGGQGGEPVYRAGGRLVRRINRYY